MPQLCTDAGPGQDWIGLDVGGANLKAAHSRGQTLSVPFEVWKHPENLSDAIARLASAMPPCSHLALTMTAELCDCFPSKSIGVNAIIDSVIQALPGREVLVWGVDQRFHSVPMVRETPLIAAAANWMALATLCAKLIPEERGLLID